MITAIVLMSALAIGGPDEDAAAALALAQANQKKPQPKTEKKHLSYAEGQALAAKNSVPLVVFVGVEPKDIYVLVCRADSLEGYKAPCVVVTQPGGTLWFATLPATATAEEIVETVEKARGRKSAAPFQGLRLGEVPIADGSEDISGRLTFLKDLVPYKTATMTQLTQRRVIGSLSPFARNKLTNDWQVPGGLDGVRGWSSQLFKSREAVATVGLVRQDPNDGVSAVTWGRSYPDGSVFADVLRNAAGRVFEVRIAEKYDGKWDRYVVYRNHDHAPSGFRKFRTSQCGACHDQAGSSEYGGAAVPGGDTILSDPYDHLERGETINGGGNGTRYP